MFCCGQWLNSYGVPHMVQSTWTTFLVPDIQRTPICLLFACGYIMWRVGLTPNRSLGEVYDA